MKSVRHPGEAERKPATARINFACAKSKLVAVAYDLKKTVLLASSVQVPQRRGAIRTGFSEPGVFYGLFCADLLMLIGRARFEF